VENGLHSAGFGRVLADEVTQAAGDLRQPGIGRAGVDLRGVRGYGHRFGPCGEAIEPNARRDCLAVVPVKPLPGIQLPGIQRQAEGRRPGHIE